MLESVIAAALFTAVALAYFGWVQLAVWVLPFVPFGAALGSTAWLVYMVAQAPFEYTGATATVQITDPTWLQWAVIWLLTYVALTVWRHLVRLGVSILATLAGAAVAGLWGGYATVSAAWSRLRGRGAKKTRGRKESDPAGPGGSGEERIEEAHCEAPPFASRPAFKRTTSGRTRPNKRRTRRRRPIWRTGGTFPPTLGPRALPPPDIARKSTVWPRDRL